MESLLVVTTTEATSNDGGVRRAVDALHTQADVQVCHAVLPGELDGILHRRGGRTLVVAGGDAALHWVVAALHRRGELDDTTLGLLPRGASNDFARGVGIPLDPEAAALTVLGGAERRLDVLADCCGSVVLHAVHLGVDAAAARRAGSRRGRFALLPARRRLRPPPVGPLADLGRTRAWGRVAGGGLVGRRRCLHVRVEADGEVLTDFDRPVHEVRIGTAPDGTAGVLARVAAARGVARPAHSGDGEAARAEPAGRAETPGHPDTPPDLSPAGEMPSDGERGRWPAARPAEPGVLVRRAAEVRVLGQRFWLNADGEVSGPEHRRTWRVSPGRLRMILPRAAPAGR